MPTQSGSYFWPRRAVAMLLALLAVACTGAEVPGTAAGSDAAAGGKADGTAVGGTDTAPAAPDGVVDSAAGPDAAAPDAASDAPTPDEGLDVAALDGDSAPEAAVVDAVDAADTPPSDAEPDPGTAETADVVAPDGTGPETAPPTDAPDVDIAEDTQLPADATADVSVDAGPSGCINATDCAGSEDGDLCNGTLYCDKATGQCKLNPATVVACDSSQDTACAKAVCNPANGKCVGKASAEGTPCDDGLQCTVGDICTAGACVGGTDTCLCTSDADCAGQDDGDLCNGVLFCNKATKKCAFNPATVVNCPSVDDTPCNKNLCEPKTGKCALTAVAEGKPCDDGNNCTPNEACAGGTCKATQNICQCAVNADCAKAEDGNLCNGTLYCNNKVFPYKCEVNPTTVVVCATVDDTSCTKATCQPKSGTCAPVALPDAATCDADGNPCTPIDHCKQGACVADANVCQCQNTADCAAKDDTDLCNGKLYCDKTKNVCKVNPATVVVCGASFDTPCLENRCDKANGKCSMVAINDNAACDADGNPCTVADTCASGACVAASNTCECTSDADCAAKEDGNPCNGTLYCDKTVFKCAVNPKTTISCPSVGDKACSKNLCNPKTAQCTMTAVLQGKPCDADGNACTLYDTCDKGACKLAANLCDCEIDSQCGEVEDGKLCNGTLYCDKGQAPYHCNVGAKTVVSCPLPGPGTCTVGICDEKVGGCIGKPYNEGQECADGNLCTTGDVCKSGTCSGLATACDDKDACTLDACNGANGNCENKVKVCQDGNECTQDQCDALGACTFTPASDGSGCTKADACTAIATCFGGVCKSVPNACDDKNACTKDSCDSTKGCINQAVAGPCDDGDKCSSGDGCTAGTCTGKPKCDDGDLCTADSCNADTGACTTTTKGCTDNNLCTDDSCNKANGQCASTPNTVICEDGNACTVGDACAAGSCTGKAKCDDGKACTVDSCSGSDGTCVHTGKNCDDNNPCTVDACNAMDGVCSNKTDDTLKPSSTCTLPGNECALAVPACSGGKAVCSNGGADPNKDGAGCKSGNGICQAGACNSRPAVVSAMFGGPYKAGDSATLTVVVVDADNDATKPTSDVASLTVDLTAVGGDAKAKPTFDAAAGTQQTWTLALVTTGLAAGAHLVAVTVTDKAGAVAVGYAVLLIQAGNVITVGPGLPYKTVKAGIDAAVSGDTVVLSPGTYAGTGNKNLSMPPGKNLHIVAPEGPDKVAIDCANVGRFLTVSDAGKLGQLVLSGLTIKNCGAGAVRVTSTSAPAELTLHNVKLLDNTNGDHGAGVHVVGSQASVQVIASTLKGNQLTGFGGGALYVSKGTLTVLGSTLSDNKSIYNGGTDSGRGGGILSLEGNVVVRDSVLTANFAQGYKGHACAATGGSFELTRTLVTATEEALFLYGVTTVVADQLTVIGGSAQLSVLNCNGSALVKDAVFMGGSTATSFSGTGKLTLTNSRWLDSKGQALSVSTMPTVASGLLVRNVNGAAMDNRAIAFGCGFSGTPVTIKDSVFRNNSGKSYGAFNGVGCTFDIDGCTFDGNTTGDLGGGAYIMAVGVVRNSVFVNNQCTGGGGGGLIVAPNPMFSKPMELHNVLLVNNKAATNGGGVLVLPQNAGTTQPVVLRGLTVTGNTAKTGGGIAVKDSIASLQHSILFGNTDTDTGGNAGDQFWAAATANTKPTVQWTLCNGDEGQFGDAALKVNEGNGFIPGSDGNLDGDPLFVAGPKGGWYLAQIAAGQTKTSPAVDPSGGVAASGFSWGARTTRTDGVADTGALDCGWHW